MAEPEILVLFKNWLDELEEDVVLTVKSRRITNPVQLAEHLGMSRSGATFLMTKLQPGRKDIIDKESKQGK